MSARRQRLPELDLAKGLAIFLVVLGHLGSRSQPLDNAWYEYVTVFIYEFHMPFFVFLSGTVFQITFKPAANLAEFGRFVKLRAMRLLPAFVAFALLIWAAKMLASGVVHVDNVRGADVTELLNIFVRPTESVATSLWYIYVLFQLTVVSAVVLTLTGGRLWPLVFGAAILTGAFHLTTITTFLAASAVCEFALFFALGAVFAKYYATLSVAVRSRSLLFYSLFAFSFVAMLVVPHPASKAVIGAFSLPALFAFASSFQSQHDRSILLTLGEYTFTIYLLNTLFIGAVKAVMIKLGVWDGRSFLVCFPIVLAAGVIGPILVHKLVFSRVPLIARYTK